MSWVTNEVLKSHGFRKVRRRTESVICRSIFTPLGDAQFVEVFDALNGLFAVTRYPDADDASLSNSVIVDLANAEELEALLKILGKPR